MKLKKILSIVLTLCVLLGALPAVAIPTAATETTQLTRPGDPTNANYTAFTETVQWGAVTGVTGYKVNLTNHDTGFLDNFFVSTNGFRMSDYGSGSGNYTATIYAYNGTAGELENTDYVLSTGKAVTSFSWTDKIAPKLTAGEITRDSATSAKVSFRSNESGIYTYTLNAGEPSESLTLEWLWNTLSLSGLASGAYTLDITASDADGNSSSLQVDIPAYVEPDSLPPTLTLGEIDRSAYETASVKFTVSEAGSYTYQLLTPEGAPIAPASMPIDCEAGEQTVSLTGLAAGAKKLVIIATDEVGNVSEPLNVNIPDYADSTPPELTPGIVDRSSIANVRVTFTTSEEGKYYYVVYDEDNLAPQFPAEGVDCGKGGQTINLSELTEGSKIIFIKMIDNAGLESGIISMPIPAEVAETVVATLVPAEHASWYDNENFEGEPITSYEVKRGEGITVYVKCDEGYSYGSSPSYFGSSHHGYMAIDAQAGTYRVTFNDTDIGKTYTLNEPGLLSSQQSHLTLVGDDRVVWLNSDSEVITEITLQTGTYTRIFFCAKEGYSYPEMPSINGGSVYGPYSVWGFPSDLSIRNGTRYDLYLTPWGDATLVAPTPLASDECYIDLSVANSKVAFYDNADCTGEPVTCVIAKLNAENTLWFKTAEDYLYEGEPNSFLSSSYSAEAYSCTALSEGTKYKLTYTPTAGGSFALANPSYDTNSPTSHIHSICGETCTHTDASHESVSYIPTDTFPTESGHYYLISDISMSRLSLDDKDIVLCLNGHDIVVEVASSYAIRFRSGSHFTLCDCASGGSIRSTATSGQYSYIVELDESTMDMYGGSLSYSRVGVGVYDSTFNLYGGELLNNWRTARNLGVINMYGGKIAGNVCTEDSAVIDMSWPDCVFNMYGGEISGNYSPAGGAVFRMEDDTAYVNIYGGTITGNISDGNGAIEMYNGHLTVSGDAVISGNLDASGNESNIFYYNNNPKQSTITVGELTEGAEIGIRMDAPGIFSIGGSEYVSYFTPDAEGYAIHANASGNLQYYLPESTAPVLEAMGHIRVDGNTLRFTFTSSEDADLYYTTTAGDFGVAKCECVDGEQTIELTGFTSEAVTLYVKAIDPSGNESNVIAYNIEKYAPHLHPICGTTCTHDGAHTENAEFKPLLDLEITEAGHYYLTEDISGRQIVVTANSGTVVLCLNGKTFAGIASSLRGVILTTTGATLVLCDCVGTGVVTRAPGGTSYGIYGGASIELYGGKLTGFSNAIVLSTSLKMYGGEISGNGRGILNYGAVYMYGGLITKNNCSESGGGIASTSHDACIYMYGGEISYNSANGGGGGVYINATGSPVFEMYGGVIKNNTATSVGGGVEAYRGAIKVSGDAKIYDNQLLTEGLPAREHNVFLYNNENRKTSFSVGELTEGAKIGLSSDEVGVISDGGGAYAAYFFADANGGTVSATEEGGLRLDFPDIIPPELTLNSVERVNDSTAYIQFTSTEIGTYYYLLYPADQQKPAFDTSGEGYEAATENTMLMLGTLSAGAYKLVIAFKDGVGNFAAQLTVDIDAFTLPEGHAHPLCADACEHKGTEAHAAKVFTEWTSATSLPTRSGSYYLTTDVVLDSEWVVDAEFDLCLNGYSITYAGEEQESVIYVYRDGTLNICDCNSTNKTYTFSAKENGVWTLDPEGEFTVNGGIITGATDGGIYNLYGRLNFFGGNVVGNENLGFSGGGIVNCGTLTMYGGSVMGNRASRTDGYGWGGGVHNDDIGNGFTMYGGLISHNVAAERGGGISSEDPLRLYGGTITENHGRYHSGGVLIYAGDVYVAGSVKIFGNTANDPSEENNVTFSLNNTYITVEELASDAKIGINRAYRVFTVGGAEYIANFFSDVTIDRLYADGENLAIERYDKPVLGLVSAKRVNHNKATIEFSSTEYGSFYYAFVPKGEAMPAIDTSGEGYEIWYKSGTDFEITDLTMGAMDVYIIAKSESGKLSEPLKAELEAYNEWAVITLKTESDKVAWYDNPECEGEPITSIVANKEDTLTLYIKYHEHYYYPEGLPEIDGFPGGSKGTRPNNIVYIEFPSYKDMTLTVEAPVIRPSVYVGSLKLSDGEWTADGVTVQTGTPSGSYAYYQNKILILKDFTFTAPEGKNAILFEIDGAVLAFEGTNNIAAVDMPAIIAPSDLSVRGDGTLAVTSANAEAVRVGWRFFYNSGTVIFKGTSCLVIPDNLLYTDPDAYWHRNGESDSFTLCLLNNDEVQPAGTYLELTDVNPNAAPDHVHNWSSAWSTDINYHWHECTAEGCDIVLNYEKNGYGAHQIVNLNSERCSVCNSELVGAEGEHRHAVCGFNCSHTDAHSREYFAKWGEEGYQAYYLTQNTVLDDTWVIDSNITLCLNGYSLSYGGTDEKPVILIDINGSLTLCDCNSTNTQHSFTIQDDGLWVPGTGVTVAGGVITGGKESGIEIKGSMTMYGGTIVGNTSAYAGGGVYIYMGYSYSTDEFYEGSLSMLGGTITGNTAPDGGGVYNEALFEMSGGLIQYNVATQNGGGICNDGALIVRDNAKIIFNKAKAGGGVYTTDWGSEYASAYFEMTGGSISSNTVGNALDGVYAAHDIILSGNALIDKLYLEKDCMIEIFELGEDSEIKIAKEGAPAFFSDNGGEYIDRFTSADKKYGIYASGGKLGIGGASALVSSVETGRFSTLYEGYTVGSTLVLTFTNTSVGDIQGIAAAITVGADAFEIVNLSATSVAGMQSVTVTLKSKTGLALKEHTGTLTLTWTGNNTGISVPLTQTVSSTDFEAPILTVDGYERPAIDALTVMLSANEVSKLYYAACAHGAAAPTVDIGGEGILMDANVSVAIPIITGALDELDVYVVLVDEAGNASEPICIPVLRLKLTLDIGVGGTALASTDTQSSQTVLVYPGEKITLSHKAHADYHFFKWQVPEGIDIEENTLIMPGKALTVQALFEAHNYKWIVDTEPTVETPGVMHQECSDCGAVQSENTPLDLVPINETTFPDAVFRAYVETNLDTDKDGYLSLDEREAVISLALSELETISDLTGIEHFGELVSVNVSGHSLKALDLSANVKLKTLDISGNAQLTTLNIGKNNLLEVLICEGNSALALPSISHLIALKELNISGIKTTASIDLTHNTALEILKCRGIGLTVLDVSKNTALKTLDCSLNNLLVLDLEANTALTELASMTATTIIQSPCARTHDMTALGKTSKLKVISGGVMSEIGILTVNKDTTQVVYTYATGFGDTVITVTLTASFAEHVWASTLIQGETTHYYECENCDEHKDEKKHCYSYTMKDNVSHIATCSDCGKSIAENCSGGTATCQAKAICSVCHTQYGELGAHSFDASKWGHVTDEGHAHICMTEGCQVTDSLMPHDEACGHIVKHDPVSNWSKDDKAHWHGCEGCDEHIFDKAEHTYDNACDTECLCGHTRTVSHDYSKVMVDGDKHYFVCAVCGAEKADSRVSHSGGNATCQTKANCIVCNAPYGELGAHQYDAAKWGHITEEGHAHVCTVEGCGSMDTLLPHDVENGTCKSCAYSIAVHEAVSSWSKDDSYHWHGCESCDEHVFDKAEHTYDNACDTECLCGHTRTVPHEYSKIMVDGDEHYFVCAVCGAEKTDSREPHSGGEATETEQAQCEVCQAPYGELEDDKKTKKPPSVPVFVWVSAGSLLLLLILLLIWKRKKQK